MSHPDFPFHGLEAGCAKCHKPLGRAFMHPDRLRHALCAACSKAHRADNLRKFEEHRKQTALPSAGATDTGIKGR